LAVFFVPVFYVVIRRIFPGHARNAAAAEGEKK
jgi:hypothetical protein